MINKQEQTRLLFYVLSLLLLHQANPFDPLAPPGCYRRPDASQSITNNVDYLSTRPNGHIGVRTFCLFLPADSQHKLITGAGSSVTQFELACSVRSGTKSPSACPLWTNFMSWSLSLSAAVWSNQWPTSRLEPRTGGCWLQSNTSKTNQPFNKPNNRCWQPPVKLKQCPLPLVICVRILTTELLSLASEIYGLQCSPLQMSATIYGCTQTYGSTLP